MTQTVSAAGYQSVRCRDVTVQIQTVVFDRVECLCLEDVQRRFPSVTALCVDQIQLSFLRDTNGHQLVPLRIEAPLSRTVNGLEPIDKSSQTVDTVLDRLDATMHHMDKKTDLILSNTQETLLRIKHAMTLMYELHEYTTPRYFFILPVNDRKWTSINSVHNFFLLHYKLYFLCECSNEPDKLHIAPHDGYSIKKPSEFIANYGSYLRTTLRIARGLLSVGGFVIPHSGNVSAMVADTLPPFIQEPSHYTEVNSKLDVVERMLNQSHQEITGVDASMMRQVVLPDVPLQGAQLRELEVFLDLVDGKHSLGNLYRTMTDDGHVRWVCLEHYNAISFSNKMTDYARQLEAVGGKINLSRREIILTGKVTTKIIAMLCAALKSGFSMFALVLQDCSINIRDLDNLFDVIINRSSIRRLIIFNVKVRHWMRTSNYICNHLTVDLRNQSLKAQISSSLDHEDTKLVVRLLQQNKICRTFHFSGYDLPLADTALLNGLKNYCELTSLVITHFMNVDFLSAIIISSSTLRRLKLSFWFNSSSTLFGLCQAIQRNQTLVELDLMDHTCLDDKTGTTELLTIIRAHPSIRHIRLHAFGMQPSNENETCLIESLRHHTCITHLRLSQSIVSEEFVEALAHAAGERHSLTFLDIHESQLNEQDIVKLQLLHANESLTHLTISSQPYWSVALAGLRTELLTELSEHQNTKLEQTIAACHYQSSICLDSMELTDHDMDLVARQAIIEKQCILLSLQSNKITSIGISIIADTLRNNSALETLYLSNNYIADDGVDYLVQVLSDENYPLKTCILQKNRITDRGVQSLAHMLNVNRTLTWLYLGENAISDAGVRRLAKSIEHSNRTLEMLVLSSNKLVTDACVDDLLSMVEHNQTLKKLWIDGCNLSEVGRQRFQAMQQSKPDLYIRF